MSELFAEVEFTTDPDTLADDAVEYLQDAITGWVPSDGHLESHLIEALARIGAEVATVASQMQEAAFRTFGTDLVGLQPLEGAKATMVTTWTARDNRGYTIPAGTLVQYAASGDDVRVFATTAEATILAGATTAVGVTVEAEEVGVAWNAVPAGALDPVDALSWVSSIVATTASSGGVDAETDGEYLDRLTAELQLLTPRPILPDDFAALARRVTGVTRCLALDGYDPGTDEVQEIEITGSPTGGTFTLTFDGQTTAGIAYNAAASAVQSALEALSNIGAGNVTCTGGPLPGSAVTVTFGGALAVTDVAEMTTTDSLTGGTAPASAVTTTVAGVAPSTGNDRAICVVPVDADGAAVSADIRQDVVDYLDALREVNFVVTSTVPTSTTINVAFTVDIATGYDSAEVLAAAEAAVGAFLDPGTWGGGGDSPPVWRSSEDTVRYLDVAMVVGSTPGVAYVSAVSVNSGTADVTLTGAAPLPAAGTVTGTAL